MVRAEEQVVFTIQADHPQGIFSDVVSASAQPSSAWSGEAAALQPFGQQAQSVASMSYAQINNRLPILFVLPIIYGLSLAVHKYKTYKAILKYGSDCSLFFVAAITSAYLVIDTTNENVDFFNNYMKKYYWFSDHEFFCCCCVNSVLY